MEKALTMLVFLSKCANVVVHCFIKQEPYGHLTSASVIIDRFNMVSVGYPHRYMPLLQLISFILNGS